MTYPSIFGVGIFVPAANYQYSPTSGLLQSVSDILGAPFSLHTDLRGQLDTLYMLGQLTESFAFDPSGRITADRIDNASSSAFKFSINPIRATSRTYDARDKALTSTNAVGMLDAQTASYTGLGYLASSSY